MSEVSTDRIEAIFAAAVERLPDQRAAYVEQACGTDAALQSRVGDLLRAFDRADDVLGEAPPSVAEYPTPDRLSEAVGTQIGRYTIRRVIASGGMGTVYEAVQDNPRRAVALKVLRRGAASRRAMRRFQHEAEILGRLQHANIAHIHEAGTIDEGEGAQPFFVMELIKGRPLLERAATEKLGTRDRLALFVKVCDAAQYAHHKGVIHRDLKPDNILVDDQGEPKILDFGIARATDSDIQTTTLRTSIGELIGTVPYMSPEQVAGDPIELDTRSD
ncbi:MAG: serine/threonine-protein kinase, partial [Planctomycetota bacterium]